MLISILRCLIWSWCSVCGNTRSLYDQFCRFFPRFIYSKLIDQRYWLRRFGPTVMSHACHLKDPRSIPVRGLFYFFLFAYFFFAVLLKALYHTVVLFPLFFSLLINLIWFRNVCFLEISMDRKKIKLKKIFFNIDSYVSSGIHSKLNLDLFFTIY